MEILEALSYAWRLIRPEKDNPFSNSGAVFRGEKLTVRAYDWGSHDRAYDWGSHDDEDEEPNLEWRDLKVSWYKHCSRGVEMSRKLTYRDELELLLDGISDFLLAPDEDPDGTK